MNTYTCPMHLEIEQSTPGRCPHCGMKLVLKSEVASAPTHHGSESVTWKSYLPLIVIIGLILLTSITISIHDSQMGQFAFEKLITYFMSGFFIVFAGFKLMDLKGFAEGYSTYDLLAKKWFTYGYIYPFIELFFGLAMILNVQSNMILLAELVLMTFSGVGVAIKLLKHEKFQCACLGTFLKVPLTKVTLIEDFGMAALAGIMLILNLIK